MITETESQLIAQAVAIIDREIRTPDTYFTNPVLVKTYLKLQCALLESEVFGVLFLTTRHGLIANDIMFNGTIDGASVHPREVVKAALRYNAAAVVVYHNHPSGIGEPSAADQRITDTLAKALQLIDVRLLDHLIVAGQQVVSFAERGLV